MKLPRPHSGFRIAIGFVIFLVMMTLAVVLAAPFVLHRELEPVDVSAMRSELFDLNLSYNNALDASEDWFRGEGNVLLLGEQARQLLHRTNVFLARPGVRDVLPDNAAPLQEVARLLRARLEEATSHADRTLTTSGASRVADAITMRSAPYLRYVSDAFHRLGAVAAQERTRIENARAAVQWLSALLLAIMALAATILMLQSRRLKRTGTSLQTTAQELSDAHRIARIGSFRWDFVRDQVQWSDRLSDIFGLETGGRMTGTEFEALVHPEDLAKVRESERRATQRAAESGRPAQREISYRLRRPDGRIVDVHSISEITSDEENRPVFMTSTVRDVTEEMARRRALAESERSLAEAQRIAGLGSFRRNIATGEVVWSREMYRMLGMEPDTAPPPVDTFIHPDDLPQLKADLNDLTRNGGPPGGQRPTSIRCRMLHRDGSLRFVHGAAEMTYDDNGHPVTLTGTLRDMTTEVAQQEAITRAAEEARRANAAKSDFLAVMSHELRTPMNGVLGMLSVLSDTPLSAEQRTQLAIARSSAEALLAILNDILDMSKIEAGRMELEKAAFDLPLLTEAVVALYMPQAQAMGLILRHEIGAGVPPWVEGDPGRLRQILLNLISNAVKFTAEGSVTLSIAVAKGGAGDPVRLVFRVRDTGMGIPAERQPLVFERFNQLDATYNRKFGGTGLGLAISRNLTEIMGGTIRFSSTYGKGTEFVIEMAFPLAQPEAPEDAVDSRPSRPLDILVAEDNTTNQIVVRTMLERLGHRVSIVDNGRKAVLAADQRAYDIVLMDISMPEMDGLEATRRIRAGTGPSRNVPILALTAHAGPAEADRCRETGLDGLLSKPIRRQALEEALERHAVQTPAAPAFRLDDLRAEFSDEELSGLIDVALSDLGRHAVTLTDPQAPDADVTRACHSVVGLARTFGAKALGDAASALERTLRAEGPAAHRPELLSLHTDLMAVMHALRDMKTTWG